MLCIDIPHYLPDVAWRIVDSQRILYSRQDLKKAPEKFDSLMSDHNFLEATYLIVSTSSKLREDLKDVEGLSDIRATLNKRREVAEK